MVVGGIGHAARAWVAEWPSGRSGTLVARLAGAVAAVVAVFAAVAVFVGVWSCGAHGAPVFEPFEEGRFGEGVDVDDGGLLEALLGERGDVELLLVLEDVVEDGGGGGVGRGED